MFNASYSKAKVAVLRCDWTNPMSGTIVDPSIGCQKMTRLVLYSWSAIYHSQTVTQHDRGEVLCFSKWEWSTVLPCSLISLFMLPCIDCKHITVSVLSLASFTWLPLTHRRLEPSLEVDWIQDIRDIPYDTGSCWLVWTVGTRSGKCRSTSIADWRTSNQCR